MLRRCDQNDERSQRLICLIRFYFWGMLADKLIFFSLCHSTASFIVQSCFDCFRGLSWKAAIYPKTLRLLLKVKKSNIFLSVSSQVFRKSVVLQKMWRAYYEYETPQKNVKGICFQLKRKVQKKWRVQGHTLHGPGRFAGRHFWFE